MTGRPSDGSYQLYTVVPADKAAILPDDISYTDGVVVVRDWKGEPIFSVRRLLIVHLQPFAVEAAVCALSVKEPGPCMPGVSTPALSLPYPTVNQAPSAKKTIVVYGGSSSVGSMTTQIATAAGITVIAIAGAHNGEFARQTGATEVFDHKDETVVEKVIEAVKATGNEFVGIFDAISTPDTYARDLEILEQLGGGHLAAVHPPPAKGVPSSVKTGMIFAVNDVAAPVFKDFVTPALESGKLKCLPAPTIVGKGLQHVDDALKKSKAGVSATKLVVKL